MRRILISASLALFGLPLCHADTLRTFDVSAVLDPNTGTGGSVSGSIVIDVTTGIFSSSSLDSMYGAQKYTVSTLEKTDFTTNGSLVVLTFGSIGNSPDAFLSLVLPTTTLVGYSGGVVCNDSARCTEGSSHYSSSYFAPHQGMGDGLTSGFLTLHTDPDPAPIASMATPEPSSIALLGTGILGASGLVRRRFGRA